MKPGFAWGLVAGVAAYWAYQHFTGMGNTGKSSTSSKGRRAYG